MNIVVVLQRLGCSEMPWISAGFFHGPVEQFLPQLFAPVLHFHPVPPGRSSAGGLRGLLVSLWAAPRGLAREGNKA